MYKIIFSIAICCLSATIWAGNANSVSIKGVKGDVLQNVQNRLDIVKKNYDDNLASTEFLKSATENVKNALEPYGYFKAEVLIKKTKKGILVEINPGPALKISKVDLKIEGPGQVDPAIQKFIQDFPISPGQTLSIEKYEKAKEQFFLITSNQGYLKATLEKKEISVDLKDYTATITLHFNTGKRYYFGDVVFKQSPYSTKFLKRFVSFKKNEPFSTEKLLHFQKELRESHFFKEVDVSPDFNHPEMLNVPVNVAIIPPKSQRYDIGIGFGTSTGPRFTLGTELRRLTDTGQHLNAQLKLSSFLNRLSAKYFIPGANPVTDQYVLGANIQSFTPRNGHSFSETLSASYQKSIRDWKVVPSINYLNEKYKVENEPIRTSQVLYPSLSISRIKTDNIISPRFGSMFNFTVQGAHTSLFSKINFFQTEIKGKYIFSPSDISRVILRGDLGYTIVEDLDKLPLTFRYVAGGMGSIRGYPYSTFGPGKYLKVASTEYQHRIKGDWYGAVFYDVGNASNKFNDSLYQGAGIGLIYQSIIGPVKLYVGQGLSKPGKPLKIEFSIGPDF